MSPITMLGLVLVLGIGYVYLRRKKDDDAGLGGISPLLLPEGPEVIVPTQVVYYPEDDIPDILQKPLDVTWYHPYYGCPAGYSVKSIWSGGGGPEIPGQPGAPNPNIYCQRTEPFMREDVLRYPLSVYQLEDPAGGSSAFKQWYTRYNVLTNFMSGLQNTMNYRALDIPSTIDISELTYGGTGAVPNPIQYPLYL